MGTRQLEYFFSPKTIAVIGASDRQGSMGGAVVKNLMESSFPGKIYPVNSKDYKEVLGMKAYSSIRKIKDVIELAIVCTPPDTVGKVLAYLDRSGVPAAIVLSGGLSRTQGFLFGRINIAKLIDRMKMRILGPECLGLISPHSRLNASYSHVTPIPGNIAYIGQSGTFGSAMLDWAVGRNIGFSHFVTLGQGADVRLSDIADYLLSDIKTKAVVIQLDRIRDARRLIRSLRTLARRKPVVGLISHSDSEETLAALGLNTTDDIYTSVMSRAGVLRASSIDELFNIAEILTRMRPLFDSRLAVIGNGQGTTEYTGKLIEKEVGPLTKLSNSTIGAINLLDKELKIKNPLALPVSVDPQKFEALLEILVNAREVDAIVVTFAPTRGIDPCAIAKSVTKVARQTRKNIFAVWMGEASVEEARHQLDQSGALTFETPHQAITALNRMIAHQRHQEALSETPVFLPLPKGDSDQATRLLDKINGGGRHWFLPEESIEFLKIYGIQQVNTRFSENIEQISAYANEIGYPVALKIVHKEYCHPFAYGSNPQNRWRGVEIDLDNGLDVMNSANKLAAQLKENYPYSRHYGFSVQPMKRTLDVPQFSAGITRHPTLGPVIFVGQGGAKADIFSDRKVAVPPLNTTTAKRLIEKTRLHVFIQERAANPESARAQMVDFLLRLNQISAEQKNVSAVELNGFIHPDQGVLILGSACEVGERHSQLFRSYPAHLTHEIKLKSGEEVTIRPVMAEDEPYLQEFLNNLSPEDMAFRFFTRGKKLRHQDMVLLSQIDYDREMAFVALNMGEILGEVRVWIDPDSLSAEYAIVVADEAKGKGLGKRLMQEIIDYCNSRRVTLLYGLVLSANQPMLGLAESVGLSSHIHKGSEERLTCRLLTQPESTWQKNRLKTLFDLET